jgi:hypothetical protein
VTFNFLRWLFAVCHFQIPLILSLRGPDLLCLAYDFLSLDPAMTFVMSVLPRQRQCQKIYHRQVDYLKLMKTIAKGCHAIKVFARLKCGKIWNCGKIPQFCYHYMATLFVRLLTRLAYDVILKRLCVYRSYLISLMWLVTVYVCLVCGLLCLLPHRLSTLFSVDRYLNFWSRLSGRYFS